MLTGSSTEAISKGYVAILAKEPCEFGKDFRWDRKIRMAQSYAEKSMLCYIEIWVSCAVMLLFLEIYMRLAGVCLPAASGTVGVVVAAGLLPRPTLPREKQHSITRHTYCLLELQTSKLLMIKAYTVGVDILNVMRFWLVKT